jgi:hypothetical protein
MKIIWMMDQRIKDEGDVEEVDEEKETESKKKKKTKED